MANMYAIHEKSFRYRGGYPDLPKLASGTVVVFRNQFKVHRDPLEWP